MPDIVPGVISPNINPPTGGYGGKVDGGFIASATFLTDGATPLATAVYIDGILQTDAPLYYTQSDDGLQYVLTAYLENTVTPGSHSVYFTMDYLTPQNTTAVATTAAATLQNECMQPAATPAITGTDDGGSYTVTVTGGGAYYGVAGAVEVTVTLSDSGSGQWAQTVSCVLDAATGRYTYTAAFPGLPAAQYCASAECSYQTSTFSETLVDSTNFVSVP